LAFGQKVSVIDMENSGTVLVVDDSDFQCELIGAQLADLGWRNVLFADSGRAALELFDRHRKSIRLVISDLSMPDMDGLILMRHLAQRNLDAAIVLISGVTEEILNSAAGLASAHGLDLLGVLAKPSTTHQLRELLDKIPATPSRRPPGGGAALTPQRLRAALADGHFLPWYQPKVDSRTGKPVGVEALARWPLAIDGPIGPAEFVPAIEEAGLSDELFFSIVRTVVSDMTRWRAQGIDIKAAINLSMDSALNLSMPEQLSQIVLLGGLQPGDFVIEVTESRLMVERSVAMESLTRLSLMGFTLSIDDFGTGYSSLVQLIDLPFRELKIDSSFVQRASLELKAKTILRIAASLGVNLSMGVVAEGVETAEQLDIVRDSGCNTVQGYYFARPMPFSVCTEWLSQRSLTHQ
jgi:EAL domain-containing protein (putative c-di-GMP-specific phosphodiesterase class I)/CheY-like chemotaxis protein